MDVITSNVCRLNKLFDDLLTIVYRARAATRNKYLATGEIEPDSVAMQLIREELDKIEGSKAPDCCPWCGCNLVHGPETGRE